MPRPTEALVDLAALGRNYERARACADGRRVIAVVKADAYGHGALPCARRLAACGCADFAVLSVEEMAQLHDAHLEGTLLVLAGPHDPADAREVVERGATAVVHRVEQVAWLEQAARAGAPSDVHVELDTGMRRMGAAPDEALALLRRVGESGSLHLAGVMTHFSSADGRDLAEARAQQERFAELLAAWGGPAPMLHLANSAALLAAPALPARGDAVRPGLMLYGARPAPHLQSRHPTGKGAAPAELEPVMQFRTQVVALRRVARGDGVGYGSTWRAPQTGYVATLGAGYADGVPISLANVGEVEVGGRRVPLVGRVSMDSVGAWLGARPAAPGTPVVLFGSEGLRIEEVAARADTLSYELMVRVGARVARRCVGAEPIPDAEPRSA